MYSPFCIDLLSQSGMLNYKSVKKTKQKHYDFVFETRWNLLDTQTNQKKKI